MIDFTTVISVDEHHLRELQLTWPTWVNYRPQILDKPLVIYYDPKMKMSAINVLSDLIKTNSNVILHPVKIRSENQRENMLSPFVLDVPFNVWTPWILKLDVDTVAVRADDDWCSDKIVAPHPISGKATVIAAHRWGYTKPGHWIADLDKWAESVPELAKFPSPITTRQNPGSDLVSHRRITSWCCFSDTQWCRDIANWAGDRLPVPSHDTYTWYCAARQGANINRCVMKHYGWEHMSYRALKTLLGRS